jgi:hypothetical protein
VETLFGFGGCGHGARVLTGVGSRDCLVGATAGGEVDGWRGPELVGGADGLGAMSSREVVMGHELVKLGAEVAVAIAVVALLIGGQRVLGLPRRRVPAPVLVAVGLAGLLCVSLISHVHATATAFSQDHKHSTSAAQGLERCYQESLSGQPVVPVHAPFLDWVKSRLPRDARYALYPYAGPPDGWCVTLTLLPALPSTEPDWTIYMGTVPAMVQAQIARHDPNIQVFTTGYALARNSR